jgi:hypothetical protein
MSRRRNHLVLTYGSRLAVGVLDSFAGSVLAGAA